MRPLCVNYLIDNNYSSYVGVSAIVLKISSHVQMDRLTLIANLSAWVSQVSSINWSVSSVIYPVCRIMANEDIMNFNSLADDVQIVEEPSEDVESNLKILVSRPGTQSEDIRKYFKKIATVKTGKKRACSDQASKCPKKTDDIRSHFNEVTKRKYRVPHKIITDVEALVAVRQLIRFAKQRGLAETHLRALREMERDVKRMIRRNRRMNEE